MACTLTVDVLVEFYFADSNLPFDKYVCYTHFFFRLTVSFIQVHVDIIHKGPRPLGSSGHRRFVQAHAGVQR